MKDKILLIGGGGHCRAVIDVIELEDKYEIAGIIDKQALVGNEVLGYRVFACDDDLQSLFASYKYALVSVGHIKSNAVRVKLFTQLKEIGYHLPIIVSPLAYISKHARVDEGTVVMHHALINANAVVGKNCIINSKALIEHDCTIQDHCHISTATVLNGSAVVQEGTFFGSNAVSKENSNISGFIKAGSVVK